MDILNNRLESVNILHFQGCTKKHFSGLTETILESGGTITVPEDITIISTWTDDEKCMLLQQSKKSGFNLINSAENFTQEGEWDMRCKLGLIKNALSNVTTKYAIVLDGYDVMINNLDNIIEKFEAIGYRILYNASVNNYPVCTADVIDWRDTLGSYRYLNAGCCIGYTEDLLDLYTKASEVCLDNEHKSEQLVIRYVFSEISNDPEQRKIFFDYDRKIFSTMAYAAVISQVDGEFIII